MKKIFKWLINIILTIFIVVCIVSTVLLLNTNNEGIIVFKDYSLVVASDNNKYLNIKNNDLLILENTEFKSLKIDDIVSYTKNVNKKFPDIKFGKVVGFGNDSLNNNSLVVTNELGESIEVSEESYVGEWVNNKTLIFGSIFKILLSKTGFLIGIILPLFLLLIYEVFKMVIDHKINDTKNIDSNENDNIEVL